MLFAATTGLLLHVALFRLGTTHDCAIGQAGPSIWSRLPPAILNEVPMRRIGLVIRAVRRGLASLPSEAQRAKIPRIGVLDGNSPSNPRTCAQFLRRGL